MQCKGRYCNESKEIRFPIQSGYFTERRCEAIASANKVDTELCDRCAIQKDAGFRYKNQQSYYQGKIDEPYFENSWLFGSPRYLKYAALPGNAPNADAIAYAEAAQKTAREGGQMKAEVAADGNEKTVKKRKINPEKKVTLPKQKEKETAKSVQTRSIAIESDEPAIEAEEVVKVVLKKMEIDGVRYWHDSTKNQIYESLENQSVGKHIGRWDAEKKKLVKIFRSVETK